MLRNPAPPNWGALAIIVFACCNLFVWAGLKDRSAACSFEEAIARRWSPRSARRASAVALVSGPPKYPKAFFEVITGRLSPWGATARLVLGNPDALAMAALAFWTAVAFYFGRNQFERTLRFDAAEAKAAGRSDGIGMQFSMRCSACCRESYRILGCAGRERDPIRAGRRGSGYCF